MWRVATRPRTVQRVYSPRVATHSRLGSASVLRTPEDTTQPDRQFWTAEARNELLEHVDQQVQAGVGEPGSVRRKPEGIMLYRNRALVAVLAFTGARGGEILSTPDDRLRNGLKWKNVDLDDGIITVLGKSREWEPIGLSKRVYEYLERLERVLQPTNEEWPVFQPLSKALSYRS